jgi:hypothetical protein
MKKGSFIQSINQHGIKGSIKEQQRPLWDKRKSKETTNVTGRLGSYYLI